MAGHRGCYDAGWTDGLPVVPPTEPLVDAMLAGGVWDADEVVLREPARGLAVTARKACRQCSDGRVPARAFPVVGAALMAMGAPEFELHAVSASTGGAAILIAVNGPIRDEIAIHYKENLFGPGFRANATIGRTVRLVLRNCLAAIPGKLDKSTQGWAGKYAMCFGEDEATSPWEPYHVSLGYSPLASTVTVMAAESGHNVLNHASPRSRGTVGGHLPTRMSAFGSLKLGAFVGGVRSRSTSARSGRPGWSRGQVQEYLFTHATRTYAEVKAWRQG